jgi:DNA-binding SARP family transcriptional activator
VVPAKVRVPVADALPRERLTSVLAAAWRHRLTLVVAPAGSGKTTLLAGFAADAAVPVAWYRAESWDANESALVHHLEASLAAALPRVARGWTSVADGATAVDRSGASRALLIIDDLHALEGTPAEEALGRFIDYAPPWLAILAGSRVPPTFNLPRLRVSGELLEIGSEDLRFRAWEVERLFREFYRDPVPPADLAALARRTEGWAAGLQLFHLATRGKSAEERRRILLAVGTSSRLVREYLTRNVLVDLPEELRTFLVETCVLGRLTGDLCDRLLGRQGCARLLDELAHRQIFTVAIDDPDGSYRYHEVLRSHLDRMLVDQVGEVEARRRHELAGELLEESGASAEALAAYCRAEAWPRVRSLLGGQGERLADGGPTWVEALPPAIVRHDPWLGLASARRARAEGRWVAALDAYARTEVAFGAASTALVCQRERRALAAWLDPVTIPPADWTGLLRGGLVREPLVAAREAEREQAVPSLLVRGLLELAAGEIHEARVHLASALAVGTGSAVLDAASRLAAGVAGLLEGDETACELLDVAVDEADGAGAAWLARLGRAARRIAPGLVDDGMAAADAAFAEEDDAWGRAILALIEAWAPRSTLDPDRSSKPLAEVRLVAAERAAAGFRRLGAGVPEAWARGLAALALAETGAEGARDAALGAESFGRATGTPAARLLAYLGMAVADPARARDYVDLAASVRAETGIHGPLLALPGIGAEVGQPSRSAGSTGTDPARRNGVRAAAMPGDGLQVRTLGGFALEIDGRTVSLEGVKPRARAVLRFLSLHVEGGAHREVICEALWPDSDAQTGARSLHVAISTLRGALVAALGPEGARLISRNGDAYRLAVSPESVDAWRFDRALSDARLTRARGDVASALFGLALDLYGHLLPEDGPAEWVVDLRERYRAGAVEAARAIAEEAMAAGDLEAAVRACHSGLAIDRYQDSLWRLLIDARERAGEAGAATRDRREYAAVLDGLGVGEG